jgi:predicted permease
MAAILESSLSATMQPVAKIGLICSLGALMARKNILNDDGRLTVSRLNYFLFTPCLFLDKFSRFTASQITDSLPIHTMMLLTHVFGALLGFCLIKASSPDSDVRSMPQHVLALSAVGNVGNLPMVLVESMDASSLSSAAGLSHVLVANITASFIQFPLVNWLLSPSASSNVLTLICTPSVIATFIGLIIGQVSFLKEAIFGSFVASAVSMLSDCCIPTLLLVLGANLARDPGIAKISWATVASITAVRLLILPCIGIGMVLGACKFGLLRTSDPNLILVLLLMNSVPTALLVHNLAILHSNRADDVAAVLFWQYIFCIITLPAWMSVFVWISKAICI